MDSKTCVATHHNSNRYICGLQSAQVSLRGLETACGISLYVKCFNRVVVKKNLVVYWLEKKWLEDRLDFVFSPDVILCDHLGSRHRLANYASC